MLIAAIRNLLQEFVHSKQKACSSRNVNSKGKLAVAIIHDHKKTKNFFNTIQVLLECQSKRRESWTHWNLILLQRKCHIRVVRKKIL